MGAIIYKGNNIKGHFITLLKICEQFFCFNDEEVFSLFTCKNCPKFTIELMKICEAGLRTNSTLFLYKKYTGICDLNSYESIIDHNNQEIDMTPMGKMLYTMKKIREENEEEEHEKER